MNYETVPAMIFLKNGQQRAGVLLHDAAVAAEHFFLFVCNSKLNKYEQTLDRSLVETLPFQAVLAVDTTLK